MVLQKLVEQLDGIENINPDNIKDGEEIIKPDNTISVYHYQESFRVKHKNVIETVSYTIAEHSYMYAFPESQLYRLYIINFLINDV